jgi:hypothetical protein
MKFTLSTKPLKNVINLGIIKANVSKFYYRSSVVQISATKDTLKLNIEAASIKTKMTLSGSGDEDATVMSIVDCSTFKGLIDSIDTDIITIEFVSGGICVYAGTSKFSIPQVVDPGEVTLNEPISEYTTSETVEIKPENWQFVKDHQLYAISTSKDYPVYTNVWVGKDGDVIVGDFVASLFTHSKYSDFNSTCLLPTSLINLFTSIPDGSTISRIDKNYVLNVETDGYSMVTEFIPNYEDDDSVGNYSSDIILNMLTHPESNIEVDVAPILKFINQTSILNQNDLGKITEFTVGDGKLVLKNRSNSYSMDVDTEDSYTVMFLTDMLKRVLSNMDDGTVHIGPVVRTSTAENGETTRRVIGCIIWTDTITTIIAGQG